MKIDKTKYSKIHPEFHKHSIEDLRTTGISVVSRKAYYCKEKLKCN